MPNPGLEDVCTCGAFVMLRRDAFIVQREVSAVGIVVPRKSAAKSSARTAVTYSNGAPVVVMTSGRALLFPVRES